MLFPLLRPNTCRIARQPGLGHTTWRLSPTSGRKLSHVVLFAGLGRHWHQSWSTKAFLRLSQHAAVLEGGFIKSACIKSNDPCSVCCQRAAAQSHAGDRFAAKLGFTRHLLLSLTHRRACQVVVLCIAACQVLMNHDVVIRASIKRLETQIRRLRCLAIMYRNLAAPARIGLFGKSLSRCHVRS